MNAKEILLAAELLTQPEAFTKGAFAYDKAGNSVPLPPHTQSQTL